MSTSDEKAALLPPSPGGAPAWAVAWGATLLAAIGAALAMGLASREALRSSLDRALADALAADAGVVASAVAPLPLESVVALDAEHAREQLEARLGELAAGARLHDVALLAPDVELGTGRGWVARVVDQDLIARAAAGTPGVGVQYRATDGALYRTAYAPIPGHPRWVVGVEGSDQTLAAVDELQRKLGVAAVAAVGLAALLAGMAAAATSRPLRRLEDDLATATPTGPASITIQGPREVRHVALTARALLASIHARDLALRDAHASQMRQLEALAAAVAHEVRNPLNALGMTLERVGGADPARRQVLVRRALERLDEIEGIVERFLALSKPIDPVLQSLDPLPVVAEIAAETPELEVRLPADGVEVRADPALLRQILRNLLRNSREAGARTVTVTLSDSAPVMLDLEDDGPGLAPEAEPFSWFATTRARGTGLGLPWSRRLAQAMGGDLALLAARPARFRLLLPRMTP